MLKIGIVGACGRGDSFREVCAALGNIRVHAVCDINATGLDAAQRLFGAEEKYTDYREMLEKSGIDAVVIATPMQFHAEHSIAALERGVHVLCEVPAAVTIEECQAVTLAARCSTATYMLAENYTYSRQNVIVRELASSGMFGSVYYAEGEYIHEYKAMNETTPWRRKWQTGIDGITYGTHSLGPVLQWMAGDRVESVCCVGSGHHYTDPRGNYYENEDSCVMLCKMVSGGLVKIRVDMLSERPHSMSNYQLQGTKGCYESARCAQQSNRVWLAASNSGKDVWSNLDELYDEYLPQYWKDGAESAAKTGHGGGDYFEMLDFVDAVLGNKPCSIDIDKAMDMTLPGLVSQQSIQKAGRWLPVPDSREWL